MAVYQGAQVPIAFGWLPDKSFVSYYLFILLVLLDYKKLSQQILELTGKTAIKLKKITMDFELAIHQAFSMFIRRYKLMF